MTNLKPHPPRSRATVWRPYDPWLWFKRGGAVMLAFTAVSTLFYWVCGQLYAKPDWSALNCFYLVVITLSTTGYEDVLNVKTVLPAHLYTIALNILGIAGMWFLLSNLTALLIEGTVHDFFRRRRMNRHIQELKNHIIVCGVGTLGQHCVEELLKLSVPFVALDRDPQRIAKLIEEHGPFLYLNAEATDDDVLKEAGIAHASGLIACLSEDKDNLYVTLTARSLNRNLRIASKAIDDLAGPKLLTAGANRTVNPTAIGGLRLVSELLRPTAVTFLDAMVRDPNQKYRFEELLVEAGSAVEGRSLAQADLRRAGDVLIVAARPRGEERFIYNPKADFKLEASCVLVILAEVVQVNTLRADFSTR